MLIQVEAMQIAPRAPVQLSSPVKFSCVRLAPAPRSVTLSLPKLIPAERL